jgi:hypothetical protein
MLKENLKFLVDPCGSAGSTMSKYFSGFVGSEETISFTLNIIKWFEIHHICNYTQAIYKRLPNKGYSSLLKTPD